MKNEVTDKKICKLSVKVICSRKTGETTCVKPAAEDPEILVSELRFQNQYVDLKEYLNLKVWDI